jgi:superfamily II DNA/RNA helicase
VYLDYLIPGDNAPAYWPSLKVEYSPSPVPKDPAFDGDTTAELERVGSFVEASLSPKLLRGIQALAWPKKPTPIEQEYAILPLITRLDVVIRGPTVNGYSVCLEALQMAQNGVIVLFMVETKWQAHAVHHELKKLAEYMGLHIEMVPQSVGERESSEEANTKSHPHIMIGTPKDVAQAAVDIAKVGMLVLKFLTAGSGEYM